MHGAHDVDFVGFDRLLVGTTHQGLSREVQHDLRVNVVEYRRQLLMVANVRNGAGGHGLFHTRKPEEAGLGWRLQREAMELDVHGTQPQAQPAAFEAGVPGHEHTLPVPELRTPPRRHCHTFHGATLEAHRSSR